MAFSFPFATRRRPPGSGGGAEDGTEREVRNTDTVDIVSVNANTSRCLTCRKDRQKCARKEPGQAKCDRCLELGYNCTVDDVNAPADGKRRKLQRLKCEACRSAKVKCEPTGRVWPDKCTRCRERSLACSEPQVSNKKKIRPDGRTAATPRDIEDSDDDSDGETSTSTIRSKLPTVSKSPPRTYAQEADRPIRPHRPSMSDIVYDVRPDLQSPRNTYTYQQLHGDEIRLLVIQPDSPGHDIVCRIVTESLQNCRPYQALSYLWGDDLPNKPITILTYKPTLKNKPPTLRDLRAPKLFTRSNLFEALHQLRQRDEEVTLYVNALCINHDNAIEKYLQASRTQEIFNKASNVIVWLGTDTPANKMAFEFIPKVLDMNGFDKLIKEDSDTTNQCWDALAELMRNRLFGRRWVIQELAVARNAALRCGSHTIQWPDFSDAVALFEANLPEIQKYYKFSLASGGPINDIRAFGASTLVGVVNNVLRKTSNGQILNRRDTVEALVSKLAMFEATDPLDTIYAVTGLAKDQQPVHSILKSERGLLNNYIAFVDYCARSSGSIDIICRHWAPIMREKADLERRRSSLSTTKVQLPSWIPNVSGSAFGAPEDKDKDKQSGRVHGDSFVGLPNRCIYNASLGFPPPNFTFGHHQHPDPGSAIPEWQQQQEDQLQYDGTMTIAGYVLSPIADLGPRAVIGVIQGECLEMGGWSSTSRTVPERLWRTLVADRGRDNTQPPSWYHRACLHCLEQSGTNGDIDTTAILNQARCSHIVAHFLRRVQSVIWNRRFLLTRREVDGQKLFGLAPGAARAGDLICVLYGCSVPVVLREHVTPDDRYFEVIGESFVYGMMDGEAREGLEDSEVEANTIDFKLR